MNMPPTLLSPTTTFQNLHHSASDSLWDTFDLPISPTDSLHPATAVQQEQSSAFPYFYGIPDLNDNASVIAVSYFSLFVCLEKVGSYHVFFIQFEAIISTCIQIMFISYRANWFVLSSICSHRMCIIRWDRWLTTRLRHQLWISKRFKALYTTMHWPNCWLTSVICSWATLVKRFLWLRLKMLVLLQTIWHRWPTIRAVAPHTITVIRLHLGTICATCASQRTISFAIVPRFVPNLLFTPFYSLNS